MGKALWTISFPNLVIHGGLPIAVFSYPISVLTCRLGNWPECHHISIENHRWYVSLITHIDTRCACMYIVVTVDIYKYTYTYLYMFIKEYCWRVSSDSQGGGWGGNEHSPSIWNINP